MMSSEGYTDGDEVLEVGFDGSMHLALDPEREGLAAPVAEQLLGGRWISLVGSLDRARRDHVSVSLQKELDRSRPTGSASSGTA